MATLDTAADIDNSIIIKCHEINLAEECKDFSVNCNDIKVLTYNIRSHSRNLDNFLTLLKRLEIIFDVIILTECWLGPEPHLSQIECYKSYHTSKWTNKAGGVIAYVKNDHEAEVSESDVRDAECLCINLPNNFNILAIYRSPSVSNIDNFLTSLDDLLNSLKTKQNTILAGDVNIDILSNDPRDMTKKANYLCLMAEHGLVSAITLPTREKSCLDHIFIKTKLPTQSLVCHTSVCDHDLPIVIVNTQKQPNVQKRQMSKTDYNAVAKELEAVDWSSLLS